MLFIITVHPRSTSSKMKYSLAALLAVASTASAHYTLPELTVKGVKTGQWAYVRKTANYQSNGPPLYLFPPPSTKLTPPQAPSQM